MLDTIVGYASRGWRVIQLHRVTIDGTCTCAIGPECRSQGKHPLARDWPNAAVPEELIASTWGPAGDMWNVGLITGAPSGFWVLDVDPEHDGPALLAELERIHGALPETYRVVTGSGGWHHYFAWDPARPTTTSRGRLPKGLDVRGNGGQVAAPPSVSAKGPYRAANQGVWLAAAPDWLYELVLPRPVDPNERGTYTLPAGAGQVALEGLSETERARVGAYAQSAIAGDLDRVRSAQHGERNSTAFHAGCNAVELLNARWSQLDAQAVVDAWADAARSTGLPDSEVRQIWASAQRRVGTAHRAYPALGGTAVAGGLPPFPPTPDGYAASYPAPPQVASPGPLPAGVATVAPSPTEPRPPIWTRGLSLDDALALPPAEWIVDGWLVANASSWLIGASGIGKSFAAVALAGSVATGVPWFGCDVKPGRVLYLAAEGAAGIAPRFAAWRQEYWSPGYSLSRDHLTLFPDPVQADSAEWWELVEWAARDRFDLIILDTQARITVGLEENSNTDMGRFVDRVEVLRKASGAAVVVVHHQGKSGVEARGASALKAAAQTEIRATRDDQTGRITLRVSKQKDAAEPSPLHLMMRPPRAVGPGELVGRLGSSVVLVPFDGSRTPVVEMELTGNVALLAAVGASTFYEGVGGTRADFRRVFIERGGKSTPFYEAFNRLVTEGIIRPIIGRTGSFRWVPADERGETGELVDLGGNLGQVPGVPDKPYDSATVTTM